VVASFLHFIRHGEVYNPDKILYGRLDGFKLSPKGLLMAERTARALSTRPITKIYSSPLQRARESAAPLSKLTSVEIVEDDRLIEGRNDFEGSKISPGAFLSNPSFIKSLRNPFLPSWGEPFREISNRMLSMAEEAWNSVDDGEVALVSHQIAIWILHRTIAGIPLPHFPTQRRCSLSSVTTVRKVGNSWREESYREPAASLVGEAEDLGAV
tara:strand:- start:155 stop:790 length:636 start_codon:yes stop_codon:yes gene_type:complete